jgi:hypothetical protein
MQPRATVLNVIIDEKQTAKGVTFMQVKSTTRPLFYS